MTTETLAPSTRSPCRSPPSTARSSLRPRPRRRLRRRARDDGQVATKDILIIDYSGDLEKVWATMILASTSAAMGVKTRVFVTFWGLQVFVKDQKRITGENWMQKMLSAMQRPGISHRKLSKMNFLGHGPVDDGHALRSSTTSPAPRSSSRPPRRWASSSSRAR